MQRHLNTYAATFLVVASMLGTGILTVTGGKEGLLSMLKSPDAVLAVWIAGGVLAWIGAWCYGELARSMPRNGGEATILRELFSPTLGEIAGWTSFVVGFAAFNASAALTFAAYVGEACPGTALPFKLIACAVLVLVTGMHGFLGPLGMRLQTLLATAKFAMLAGLTLYGLIHLAPSVVDAPVPAPAQHAAGFGASWGLAMMFVGFSYSGWNAAIYVAGEIQKPLRNIRRAMLLGTTIILLLYVAINAVLLRYLPAAEIENNSAVMALLVKHAFGPQISSIFSALVAFALLSSLGVSAFLGPRVMATMLGWFGKKLGEEDRVTIVHPSLIWLQAALSLVMVLTGTFGQIITVMGFLLGLFPILCIAGLYRGNRHMESGSLTLARYVFAPVYISVSSAVLVLGAAQSPREALIALLLVLVFYAARISMRRIGRMPAQPLPESRQP